MPQLVVWMAVECAGVDSRSHMTATQRQSSRSLAYQTYTPINFATGATTSSTVGKDYTPRLTKYEWKEHNENSCTVCDHFSSKETKQGISREAITPIVGHGKERAPPSWTSTWERDSLTIPPLTTTTLPTSAWQALQLTICNILICLTCCIHHMYTHTDLSFPCCGASHSIDTVTSPVILKLLRSMELPCKRCCQPVPVGNRSTCNKNMEFKYY